jgi:flagellar hook-basal body complex protein FliE
MKLSKSMLEKVQYLRLLEDQLKPEVEQLNKFAENIKQIDNEYNKTLEDLKKEMRKKGFEKHKEVVDDVVVEMKTSEICIIDDEKKVPKSLCNHVPEVWKPDKNAIKRELKNSKKKVKYAHIETNYNLKVKQEKKEVRN